MLTLVAEALEQYAAEHAAEESPLFQELVKETYATQEAPQMQVGRLEGAVLRLLVRLVGARRVLELGTFTGYSALAMAEGLPEGGELITCDEDPEATAVARRFWARSPHGKKITLKLGKALDTLKTLTGPFDAVFIDADKANYGNYWDACLPLVRPGGLLMADNVLWNGKVVAPDDSMARTIVAFNAKVKADTRVESVILTIRDGLTIAIKR